MIKTETWIGWVAAVLVTCVGGTGAAVTFAYAQFETKERANETREMLKEIIGKVDALGGFQPGPIKRR